MKKPIMIVSLFTSVFLFNASYANAMDKNLEEKLLKVCEAVKSDSRIKLQQAVSEVPAGYKQITRSLMCNGMDPITYALHHGSQNTAKLLASRSHVDYDEMLAKL
jgi:hypothetical protein